MPLKLIFALISTVIGILSFIPYLRDIFLKKTQPHTYTWLIWTVTQGTATLGIFYGGGGVGGVPYIFTTSLVFTVFLFSLKYGTKNITRSDTVLLGVAFCAMLVWFLLKDPLLSVLIVSIVDVIGYLPSLRKSYAEPWSETLSTWFFLVIANGFDILALSEHNFLTTSYIFAISASNLILVIVCLIRRRKISKPC